MPEFTGTKDLRSYVRMFLRWKWLFLFFVIAAPAAAYAIQSGKPKVYKSTALVGVNQETVNSALVSGGGSFSTANIQAVARLVTTTPVADIAASLMHPAANPNQILGEVSASGDTTTNFITISATDRSPTRAAGIANAFARAIGLNQQTAAVAQINSQISALEAQIAHLGSNDSGTKTQLQQQLSQLRAARYTQGNQAAVLQQATPSASPAGPHVRRSMEIALVIGLLLAFGAMSVAENMDRRLRTPEDLEHMTDLPLLAAIAPSAFSGDLHSAKEDEEAFHMLRTSLMYFNVEQPLESVLITSPGEKDGKTTVATRLAVATASAGLRVVLVDADLRRAQVSARLGLHPEAGLGAVIAGERSLSDALVEYRVNTEPDATELRVLPAGPPPPNPAALISSEEMQRVLRELEADSDLVIIDTPAALAVSDPVPLMRNVSGVVLVARMNRSSRQTIRRLQRIVESAHGTLLGVVATGVSAGPGYEGYYPKYYYSHSNGTNGHGSPSRLRRLRKQKTSESA
jgi:capsular exopolysaccharide synthesis family protein